MLAEVFRLFLRLFSRAKRKCNEFPCGRRLLSGESAIKGASCEDTEKRGRFADAFSRGEKHRLAVKRRGLNECLTEFVSIPFSQSVRVLRNGFGETARPGSAALHVKRPAAMQALLG